MHGNGGINFTSLSIAPRNDLLPWDFRVEGLGSLGRLRTLSLQNEEENLEGFKFSSTSGLG